MTTETKPSATQLIPNLGFYKKQAKQLKRLFGDGDAAAVERVVTMLADENRALGLGDPLTLGDAQFVVARELGFTTWSKLKQRVLELEAAPPPDPHEVLLGAVREGSAERVRELLSGDGSLANRQGPQGELALLEACERGHTRVVRALLEAGADPQLASRHTTPLLAAIHAGPHKSAPALDIVELLLQHGVPDDIFLQAALGDVNQLEQRLAETDAINAAGPLGCTALFLAAWNGRGGAAELLLRHGADPALRGRGGQSPLACAMAHSWSRAHRAVARTLVEHGAPCTLFEACRVGHLPTVRSLLQQEDVNAPNELGYRPLDIAVFEANRELVELLIELGANDPEGRGKALLSAKVTREANLGPQLFDSVNLGSTVFHDVNLGGATFSDVNLAGARFDNVNLGGVRIQDAHIAGLTIWGVDVMPLVVDAMQKRNNEQ